MRGPARLPGPGRSWRSSAVRQRSVTRLQYRSPPASSSFCFYPLFTPITITTSYNNNNKSSKGRPLLRQYHQHQVRRGGRMDPQYLFDTHSHAHDDLARLDDIPDLPVHKIVLMGTTQKDWPVVERLHRQRPEKVLAAFGVHPYFAHQLEEGWVDQLRTKLLDNPRSIVGEIGLDKVATTPDTGRNEYDAQQQVFLAQFKLAAELQRPISLHCVRTFGYVMELFLGYAHQYDQLKRDGEVDKAEKLIPPAIIMHSFGGTVGGMESMLCNKGKKGNIQERIYFSFSKIVNMRSPKTIDVIKAVPEDRLLIESDQHSPLDGEVDLREICEIVAKARGWSMEKTAKLTHANATRIFSFAETQPQTQHTRS